jgi:uncharacterized protein (TIGR03435 family)
MKKVHPMKINVRAARICSLILCTAALTFGPSAWAVPSAEFSFDEAVIRPVAGSDLPGSWNFRFTADRFQSHNVNVRKLVEFAFHVEGREVVGLPAWAEQDRYDIQATISEETVAKLKSDTNAEIEAAHRQMMQDLLSKRFGLVTHQEQRALPGFVLLVSDGGQKMEDVAPSTSVATTPEDIQKNPEAAPTFDISSGRLHAERVTIKDLAAFLGKELGKSVEDETHLVGRYNFNLDYQADSGRSLRGTLSMVPPGYSAVRAGDDSPDLMTAVREQLGLQLKPQNVKSTIVAVDQIERPSEN